MAEIALNPLRESIRTTLALRAGSVPDARATAEAAAATWRRVDLQLAPVIGARGLTVLFSRALHQTSAVFPWLAGGVDREGSADPLHSVMACLAGQPAAAAAEASYALLLTFAELLATLIGGSLTERLLAPVWTAPSLPSYRETDAGILIGDPVRDYEGLLGGRPMQTIAPAAVEDAKLR